MYSSAKAILIDYSSQESDCGYGKLSFVDMYNDKGQSSQH